VIAHYTPQMPTGQWMAIADFTRECVKEIMVSSSSSYARQYMKSTARLVLWATQVASLDLDREEIFHRSSIDRYLETVQRTNSPKAQRNLATMLRKMGVTFTSAVPGDFKVSGSYRRAVRPYPLSEFAGLASWVGGQAHPGRRRNASAIVGFCMGAGLRMTELSLARAEDVTVDDSGMAITVGGRFARQVPVHALWEDFARTAFSYVSAGEYLVKPTAVRGTRPIDTLQYTRVAGHETPTVVRLRATWIVRSLDLLPVRSVQHFAGLGPLGAAESFICHAGDIDFEDSIALLRGTRDRW
jgi:integrase